MAASGSRIVRPWDGSTGYPLSVFTKKSRDKLLETKSLFCSRKECVCVGTTDNTTTRNVIRDPYQADCGHRFCKDCVDIIKTMPPAEQKCSACEQEKWDDANSVRPGAGDVRTLGTDSEMFDVDEDDEDMEAEPVGYVKLDVNSMRTDKAALKDVMKLEVICPFDCGTTERIIIKTLEKHMLQCPRRREACSLCTEPVAHSTMEDHLTNHCEYRPVNCPNGCGKRGLKYRDMAKHRGECAKKPPMCRICKKEFIEGLDDHMTNSCVAKCPLGCSTPAMKIVEHLADPSKLTEHMYKLLDLTLGLRDSVAGQTSQGQQTGQVQQQAGSPGMDVETLQQLSNRLIMVEAKSDQATTELERKLSTLTQESAYVLLASLKGASSTRQDLARLEGLFKVLAEDVHKLQQYSDAYSVIKERVEKGETETIDKMSKLERESQARQGQIEKQRDNLHDFQRTSFNGKLIWKISEVTKQRSESHVKHSIYSHPFYTETYGYKMCARIYFNGDGNGKNSHISLFFVVMKGDFDALLPWPFQQKVTLRLKNLTKRKPDITERFRPEPSSSSFQMPKNDMNVASGCPQFAEQSIVYNIENGYIVDDTMFVEVIVDPAYEALHGLTPSTAESTQRTGSSMT